MNKQVTVTGSQQIICTQNVAKSIDKTIGTEEAIYCIPIQVDTDPWRWLQIGSALNNR